MTDPFERDLLRIARKFSYPPTPELAIPALPVRRDTRQIPRKLVWASAVILILVGLMSTLLAVPSVRAQVMEFLQIGVIRIFFVSPTPLPTAIQQPGQIVPGQKALSQPELSTATPYPSLLDLEQGETTLEAARQKLGLKLPLPTYPPGLGEPDQVYMYEIPDPVIILSWSESDQPGQSRMVLYLLPGDYYAWKKMGEPTRFTTVNQREAVWIEDPHPLEIYDSRSGKTYTHMVLENVLIWTGETGTYRLESNLSMEEAVRVAESLR